MTQTHFSSLAQLLNRIKLTILCPSSFLTLRDPAFLRFLEEKATQLVRAGNECLKQAPPDADLMTEFAKLDSRIILFRNERTQTELCLQFFLSGEAWRGGANVQVPSNRHPMALRHVRVKVGPHGRG